MGNAIAVTNQAIAMENFDLWQTGLTMLAVATAMATFLSWGIVEAAHTKGNE